MSNSRDLGVFIESLLELSDGDVDVFDWELANHERITQVKIVQTHHLKDDYNRIFIRTSDEKRYVVQVYAEDP